MRIIIGLIALFCVTVSGFGEMRTWTGKTGQTIDAEYVKNTRNSVWLKTSSGKQKKVPISALSKADQDYIYCQTPPKVQIEVDDDIHRGTVGSDIDNVREEICCSVTVKKTSKNPYPAECEVYYFMIGFNIEFKEYFIAEKVHEKYFIDNKKSFSINGEDQVFEYDPDPAWGTKYYGYLVVVKAGGETLCYKGKDRYFKNFHNLRDASEGTHFDKKFKKSVKSKNRHYR